MKGFRSLCVALTLLGASEGRAGSRVILFNSVPSWVFRPGGAVPSVDMDFANGRYFGCTLTSCLSMVRASVRTNLLPTSSSGFAFTTFGNNVLPIVPGTGLQIYAAATNLLLNSASPATQTTGTLANGTYTLWVNGSGSATMSAGTATGCGTGVATNGTPVSFTTSGATGTCTVTVAGSLNAFQLELGSFGTPFFATSGATGGSAGDLIGMTGALLSGIINPSVAIRIGTTQVVNFGGQARLASYGNVNVSPMAVGSTTQAFRFDGSFTNTANLGSGTFAVPVAVVSAHSVTPAFDALVANQGTEVTGTSTFAGQTIAWLGNQNGISNMYLDGYISRITIWPGTTLSAVTRKALSAP